MMKNKLFEPQVLIQKEAWEIERLSELKEDWDIRRVRMKPGRLDVHISFFNTLRMQFSSVNYNNAILLQGSAPKGTVMLSIIQSKGQVSFQNEPLKPSELIVTKYGEEIDYLAGSANQILTFAIENTFFSKLFFDYFGTSFEVLREEYRLVIDLQYTKSFIHYVQKWLNYFSNEKKFFVAEIYHRIEEEILYTLFSLLQITPKYLRKEKFNMKKVRQVMQNNIDTIYTISDLVKELHISPRTLQHNFKYTLGVTPKQYFHQLRLHAIREELMVAEVGKRQISDIILKYGFFRPSHFGAVYKKAFGETPSQTLKR